MKNLTAAPKPQAPATSRVCAVPRSEYAGSESFLSKFLREMEREKDRQPGWEELLLRELTWNSARYGWDAWARLSTKPDTQADIEEFQRMAAFYEPADVNFWRPDLDIQKNIRDDEIVEKCIDLLGENANSEKDYFGCTVQGETDDTSIEPYVRPKSMTYFSDEWKGEELENMKSHELAHQLIITLGQLMGWEIQRRKTLRLPTLSDAGAQKLKKDLDALTEILDKNETADWNPSTGKLRLRRKVDVLRELKKIHCRFLRKLYDLEKKKMRLIFGWCLFFFVFLASPTFGIIVRAEPFYKDTVRDAKTGELYQVRVSSIFICRESKSNNHERGYGFEMAVEYEMNRYVYSKEPMSCPDGWEKRPTALNENLSECVYSVPLSPPLTFILDTGENRNRHFSKAERASALKRCNSDLGSVPLSSLLAGGGGCQSGDRTNLPILDFTYRDKAGKLHEVSFVRDYDSDRGSFVSQLFYPVYEETCDSGWTRWNNYWRKKPRYTKCAEGAFNSTGWEEASEFHETSPVQGTTSFGWGSLNDSGENCEKDLSELPKYRKDRCYYTIPDPLLFSPKKGKRPKKPGKAHKTFGK